MENAKSLDRTVDRLAWAPVRSRLQESEAEREARIRAQIRRIRSDPRWRAPRRGRGAA
jgi:hypothetical protein